MGFPLRVFIAVGLVLSVCLSGCGNWHGCALLNSTAADSDWNTGVRRERNQGLPKRSTSTLPSGLRLMTTRRQSESPLNTPSALRAM